MQSAINYYLLLHGHDIKSLGFKYNSQLGDYIEQVIKTNREINNVFSKDIDKKTLVKKSKAYLNKYFNIHDIGYINDKMVKETFDKQDALTIDNTALLYNNACIEMSPFDLPIDFIEKNRMYGSLLIASPLIDNQELLKKIDLFFEGIKLSNRLTNHLIPIYIHEIVHTQLESNKGIINDIKNKEVLSIFIELLYTYHQNKNDYKFFLVERLNSLMNDFNTVCKYFFKNKKIDTRYMITLSYLVSTIKALNLLNLYINSNIFIKKDIIKSIQKVFDANNSLEELLDKYEIDYDNSLNPKILSRIIK